MAVEDTPMEERCIHFIDAVNMVCVKCKGSYNVVKNDSRPWSVIKADRESRKQN